MSSKKNKATTVDHGHFEHAGVLTKEFERKEQKTKKGQSVFYESSIAIGENNFKNIRVSEKMSEGIDKLTVGTKVAASGFDMDFHYTNKEGEAKVYNYLQVSKPLEMKGDLRLEGDFIVNKAPTYKSFEYEGKKIKNLEFGIKQLDEKGEATGDTIRAKIGQQLSDMMKDNHINTGDKVKLKGYVADKEFTDEDTGEIVKYKQMTVTKLPESLQQSANADQSKKKAASIA